MVNMRTTTILLLILLCLTSCVQTKTKRSVPKAQVKLKLIDRDYELFGYNSLKGCPLLSGRDPGFTLPIFSGKGHVSQDVSCVTSFTSEVVETPYDLTKLLTLTARLGDNKWGPPFSASQDFQKLSAELRENILVVSTAVCSVYDVSLLPGNVPSFQSSFVEWIMKLNNTDDEDIYLDFLDTYGTHFVSRVRFGASTTLVHKKKARDYLRLTNPESVPSDASLFSAALFGYSETMTEEQQEVTQEFQNSVETTTFSVGAPLPYKDSSVAWLTGVKDDPSAIDYDLTSVEVLFSDTFMGNASSLLRYGIDHDRIKNNIMAIKNKYCQTLVKENLLNGCEDTSGMTLLYTKLISSPTYRPAVFADQCYEECYQLPGCVAVTFCPGCTMKNVGNHCQMFSAGEIQRAVADSKWKSTILLNKLETFVKLQNTAVIANLSSQSHSPTVTSLQDCYPSCIEDTKCLAFTLTGTSETIIKCTRHTDSTLFLTQGTGANVYFVSPLVKRIIRSGQTKGLAPSSTLNDWYKAACVIDDECRQENSVCFLNRCLCQPGYFFSTRDYTCTATCSPADLHNTFVEYPESGIKGNNIVVRYGVNLQTCKSLCNSIRDCRSFDFRATGGRCLLHDVASREGHASWYSQTSRGWTHYQRTCLQSPASYPGPLWYNTFCDSNRDCPEYNSQCISNRCLCSPGFVFFETDTTCRAAESCLDWRRRGGKSGVYFIQPPGKGEQLRVWCDMDSGDGGWLVFQRRSDVSVDFNRNWVEYENGFGDITGEFWLGFSKLYPLIKSKPHQLRVDLQLLNGTRSFAKFSVFSVGGPETSYKLRVSNYSGNAGDSLSPLSTMKFSTYDRENDESSHYHCARDFKGGWWFRRCHPSHLNGRYEARGWDGIVWMDKANIKFAEMKVRPL